MSVSSVLQTTRCYACNLQSTKCTAIKIISRRYSNAETETISVPKRIPRGPTDILRALSATVKRDPTAAHYKFHDDPYLIPLSNQTKRMYGLAQESGRKAAMWVKAQHPELFQHIEADPPIEAYVAKPRYNEFDDVGEALLLKTMKTASVNDSIEIYKLLLKTKAPISEETKLCLLELVCFFNGEEDLAEELIEERWFTSQAEQKVEKKTWKDNGFAQELFSKLSPSPRSYSAIIMGMVKYQQFENAIELYKEANANGFTLSPHTYNAMIRVTNFWNGDWTQRWKFMTNILATMNQNGCKPSVVTLNRVLDIFVRNPKPPEIKNLALRAVAEFKRLGIEPSLGTYNALLNIFCKIGNFKKEISYILEDILDEIEGKEFTVQDIGDCFFFCNAMEKSRFYYNNSDIAIRVNRVLWHGKNYNLIGSSTREAVYYRHFFLTLCQGETLETLMKLYDFYVPNIYTPEMTVMEEVINVVTMNGAVDLYPKLWTDIVLFDLSEKNKTVSHLLKSMILNATPSISSDVAIKLGETAYSVFSKTEKDHESVKTIYLEWTGEILGDIVFLCLRADRFDRATEVMKKILKDKNKMVGTPSTESVEMMIDACVQNKETKLALMLLDYCHDNVYADDKKFAEKVVQGLHLSPMYATHIAATYGQSIFKDVQATKA